jgi:hypothetical protein
VSEKEQAIGETKTRHRRSPLLDTTEWGSLTGAPDRQQGEAMVDRLVLGAFVPALAGLLLAGGILASPALAQTDGTKQPSAGAQAAQSPSIARDAAAPAARKASPYHPVKITDRAKNKYVAAWGVDNLKVSYTASGNLIRFSYRVTDPELAKALSDRKATPYLLGQKSRALLQIPVMDKVGPLRQTGAAEPGQQYWMVFSNKGNLIKPGDRVNVMIGSFRADGLMVE